VRRQYQLAILGYWALIIEPFGYENGTNGNSKIWLDSINYVWIVVDIVKAGIYQNKRFN
jgi:hypothetical protein